MFSVSAFRPRRNCCLITSNTCWYMFWGVGHNYSLMISQLWHIMFGQPQAHFGASLGHGLKVTENEKPPLHVERRNTAPTVLKHTGHPGQGCREHPKDCRQKTAPTPRSTAQHEGIPGKTLLPTLHPVHFLMAKDKSSGVLAPKKRKT